MCGAWLAAISWGRFPGHCPEFSRVPAPSWFALTAKGRCRANY